MLGVVLRIPISKLHGTKAPHPRAYDPIQHRVTIAEPLSDLKSPLCHWIAMVELT